MADSNDANQSLFDRGETAKREHEQIAAIALQLARQTLADQSDPAAATKAALRAEYQTAVEVVLCLIRGWPGRE